MLAKLAYLRHSVNGYSLTIEANISNVQIEKNIENSTKKLQEVEAFDSIGQVAVEKGCLNIEKYQNELDSLKEKSFSILPPLLGGLGLLGLSAVIPIVAIAIITSVPLTGGLLSGLLLSFAWCFGPIGFLPSFVLGANLTVSSAVDFGKKYRTQGRMVELYDKLDQAKTHLQKKC